MTHPGTDDHNDETMVRLMVLVLTTFSLHQAGWTWDQVRSVLELLAAATSVATTRNPPR